MILRADVAAVITAAQAADYGALADEQVPDDALPVIVRSRNNRGITWDSHWHGLVHEDLARRERGAP